MLALGLAIALPGSALACEGCTPGFWKTNEAAWGPTGYSPSDNFNTVFGAGPNISLGDAVDLGGGGENALTRHAVAALLNNAHPDVTNAPGWDAAAVIAAVQAAFLSGDPALIESTKNTLEALNENGCPLSADEANR